VYRLPVKRLELIVKAFIGIKFCKNIKKCFRKYKKMEDKTTSSFIFHLRHGERKKTDIKRYKAILIKLRLIDKDFVVSDGC